MAKKEYSSIIDAFLDDREPDWKDLGLKDAVKSGEEQLSRTHDFIDGDVLEEISESASHHTMGPRGGKGGKKKLTSLEREERLSHIRINSTGTSEAKMAGVPEDWARHSQNATNEDSVLGEALHDIESMKGNSDGLKKVLSDADVTGRIDRILGSGLTAEAKTAALKKLGELELFNRGIATDYLQRTAPNLGIDYLEPNTFMDKNSPTYERELPNVEAAGEETSCEYCKKAQPYQDAKGVWHHEGGVLCADKNKAKTSTPTPPQGTCGTCNQEHVPGQIYNHNFVPRAQQSRKGSDISSEEKTANSLAERLMKAEQGVWDQLGVSSGGQLMKDPALMARYERLMAPYIEKIKPTPQLLSYLENENFHLLVGLLKKKPAPIKTPQTEGLPGSTPLGIKDKNYSPEDTEDSKKMKWLPYRKQDGEMYWMDANGVEQKYTKGASIMAKYKFAAVKATVKKTLVFAHEDGTELKVSTLTNTWQHLARGGSINHSGTGSKTLTAYLQKKYGRGLPVQAGQREANEGGSSSPIHRNTEKTASSSPSVVYQKLAAASDFDSGDIERLRVAGQTLPYIYKFATAKVGEHVAAKALNAWLSGKKKGGEIILPAVDVAFLRDTLGFKGASVEKKVAKAAANRHKIAADAPVDGHQILAEYDLQENKADTDINTDGAKLADIELGGTFSLNF